MRGAGHNRFCRAIALTALVGSATLVTLAAQAEDKPLPAPEDANKPNPNRYEPILFPILGGSSDIGFLFGASGALAKLQEGYYPYRWKGAF